MRVVGVTKGFGPDAVRAALDAGLRDLGENYAAELVAKAGAEAGGDGGGGGGGGEAGARRAVWHFLGAIQRNKVADLAPVVGVWQSVAREVEGARIARFAPGATVMVQVDVTGRAGRNGCPPDGVGDLVGRLLALDLDVVGLMTVAAPGRQCPPFVPVDSSRCGAAARSAARPPSAPGDRRLARCATSHRRRSG